MTPEILEDGAAAGEGRDVLEHRLAAIAEARRLHGGAGNDPAELVHDERGERLTLDVLRDHQQWLAGLRDLLEQRDEVLDRGDLLLVDEDVRILEHALHLLDVGDEVRER